MFLRKSLHTTHLSSHYQGRKRGRHRSAYSDTLLATQPSVSPGTTDVLDPHVLCSWTPGLCRHPLCLATYLVLLQTDQTHGSLVFHGLSAEELLVVSISSVIFHYACNDSPKHFLIKLVQIWRKKTAYSPLMSVLEPFP